MIKRVDHNIMVVKNLEDSIKIFKNVLYLTPDEGGFVADLPKFRVAMFPFIGGARIELVEPKQKVESRFKKFLDERGEGVMAISFFTDDLNAQIKDLKDNGFTVEEGGKTKECEARTSDKKRWQRVDSDHGPSAYECCRSHNSLRSYFASQSFSYRLH